MNMIFVVAASVALVFLFITIVLILAQHRNNKAVVAYLRDANNRVREMNKRADEVLNKRFSK